MSGVRRVSVLVLAAAVLVYLYKAYLQTPLPVLYNGRVHPDFQEVADLYRYVTTTARIYHRCTVRLVHKVYIWYCTSFIQVYAAAIKQSNIFNEIFDRFYASSQNVLDINCVYYIVSLLSNRNPHVFLRKQTFVCHSM